MKIVFATGNKDKLNQIKLLLDDFELLSPKDVGIDDFEVVEDGATLKENAYKKARSIFDLTHLPTLADDTGLFVKAIGNRPGIYAHRYAGGNASYKDNREKLLAELEGESDRSAYFLTSICFIDIEGNPHYFEGKLTGFITKEEIGDYDFGYDQIFMPEGKNLTLGQMTSEQINLISHRSKAINAFIDFIIKRHI